MHGPTVRNAVSEEFIIGTGDVLAINVWKETEVSRVVPVRSDGRISLPLVGEIQAGGRTPKQLETEISAKLKDFVSEPEVTVIVQEIKSQKFNVLGMVMKPGSYVLTNPTTIHRRHRDGGRFPRFREAERHLRSARGCRWYPDPLALQLQRSR